MSHLRILLAEDDSKWQQEIPAELTALSPSIDLADSYEKAVQKIRQEDFDLVIVDLHLPANSSAGENSELPGFTLLSEIRSSQRNQHCGVLVISAYLNIALAERIKERFQVYKILDKNDARLDTDTLFELARKAILDARLRRAAAKEKSFYRLRLFFTDDRLLSSELTGPNFTSPFTHYNSPFDVLDLARRADMLNLIVNEGGTGGWRPEANSVGKAVYEALIKERDLLGKLVASRIFANAANPLWLEFTGTASGLGIPFELLRDENQYVFAQHHILTRRIQFEGFNTTRKTETFHQLVEKLIARQEPLQVLIIGANSDGRIPAAEAEARQVRQSLFAQMSVLGVTQEDSVTLLVGADAAYENVFRVLEENNYHLVHYCGHGEYDDRLAESSGLVLRDGDRLRTLTAYELNSLLKDKETRLVYLSSCLGSRTANRLGRGDFHSVFEALAKADIPCAIGYRWDVSDSSAMAMSRAFYNELWITFAPGEALFRARRKLINELGVDDETWASPVLMMQAS